MLKRIEIFDKQENAYIAARKEDLKKYALQKQQIAISRNRLTNGCILATSLQLTYHHPAEMWKGNIVY